MASVKIAFIVSFVVVARFSVTVSTLGTISTEVEVTRNGTSIPWDCELSNHRSDEFKQLALKVRNKLREDLGHLQGISKIKVKNFHNKHGNTSCQFECKVDPKVDEDVIERALNGTIDIGVIAPVTYPNISMSLQVNVAWIDSFSDKDSTEYKNVTSRIKDALEVIYQDTGDVVDFEINSLSRSADRSVLVEYTVMVHPDSELKKENLVTILNEFTAKNGSYGGMIIENAPARQGEGKESPATTRSDGLVTGLVVIGALVISVVIVMFFTKVLKQNWKQKVESREDRFEEYQQTAKRADIACVTATMPRDESLTVSHTSDISIRV